MYIVPSGSLGRWLYKKLKEMDMPVENFAEQVGISAREVYRHIGGEAKPTKKSLLLYSKYFGVNYYEIYEVISDKDHEVN